MGTFKDASEKKVIVEAGQVAVLDMPAIESHPAPLVTWFTDGEAQLYDRKFAVTAENQLVILDASPSDQKAYRCVEVFVKNLYYSLLGCETIQSHKLPVFWSNLLPPFSELRSFFGLVKAVGFYLNMVTSDSPCL
jgi:hypothetical protein